jgi:hypothetical protein
MGSKNIQFLADSDNGNKIFCLYKVDKIPMVKGFYDFTTEQFTVTHFNNHRIPEGQTPLKILTAFKEELFIELDWELKGISRLVKQIEQGNLNKSKNKKHKRKKK